MIRPTWRRNPATEHLPEDQGGSLDGVSGATLALNELVRSLCVELGQPGKTAGILQTLVEGWYTTPESLHELSPSGWAQLGLPQRFVDRCRERLYASVDASVPHTCVERPRPTCAPPLVKEPAAPKRPAPPQGPPSDHLKKKTRQSGTSLRIDDTPEKERRDPGPAAPPLPPTAEHFGQRLRSYFQDLAAVTVFQVTGALCSPKAKYDTMQSNALYTMVSTLVNNARKEERLLPKDPWLRARVAGVSELQWKNVMKSLFYSFDNFLQSSLFEGILVIGQARGYRGKMEAAVELDPGLGTRWAGCEALRQAAFAVLSGCETALVTDGEGAVVDFDGWANHSWEDVALVPDDGVPGERERESASKGGRRNPRQACRRTRPELLERLRAAVHSVLSARQNKKTPCFVQGLSQHPEVQPIVAEIASEINAKQDVLLRHILEGPLSFFFCVRRIDGRGHTVLWTEQGRGAANRWPRPGETWEQLKARTFCLGCMRMGHWLLECPMKDGSSEGQ